jgi:uncharacterized protein involved in response to NO
MATLAEAPFWLVAFADLAMLPLLAALLLPPLLRTRNRNMSLLVVLLVLWSAEAVFMWAIANEDIALAARAMSLAINLVLLLVTVIGGRIVPAFTANALRRRNESPKIVTRNWIESTAIGSMVLIAAVDAFVPNGAAR